MGWAGCPQVTRGNFRRLLEFVEGALLVKYDSERDFEPIGLTAHAPAVIVARKDFPAENMNEFVAYLKENGEKLKQAHGGIGASSHMACLLFIRP